MNKAEKILVQMRLSKAGWKPKHFKTLYLGFNFEILEGANHTRYLHKKYQIVVTLPRHNGELPVCYASDAVKYID